MAVTENNTVREVIYAAMEEIGVKSIKRAPKAEEVEAARKRLSALLKSPKWNEFPIHYYTSQSTTLTTAQSYVLASPERPLKILSARYRNTDGIDLPMTEMQRDEWDRLPDKTVTGTPTQWYADVQRRQTTVYVWPQLASATTESLELTIQREAEDLDFSDTIDMPSESYNALYLDLALRLCPTFQVSASPELVKLAEDAYADYAGHAVEDVVMFCPG